MPAPDELGDRATHGVADGDDGLEAENLGEGGDVIGAVLETKGPAAANPPAVTPMVEGDDVEVMAERLEAAEPVQGGGGGPPVEEDQGGRAGRAGDLVHVRRPPSGQLHGSGGGQRWWHTWSRGHRWPGYESGSHTGQTQALRRPRPGLEGPGHRQPVPIEGPDGRVPGQGRVISPAQ